MSSQAITRLRPEDYLTLERKAERRSEYFRGEVFAMSGASPAHVLIVANVVASLHGQLRSRSCSVYSTDLRIKVSASGLYTYPDVVVVCGELSFDDQHRDTVLNPTLIVEVLSDSTRDYDRGMKFEHYRKLDSFREYVLLAQDRCHAEHHLRQADARWLLSETERTEDVLSLDSIGCRLPLADVYEKVRFQES
jgi:Uma2 family endonuclease